MPDVVVAGHICLDIIPDLSHMKLASPAELYVPGKLVDTGAATLSTGGPVSNTGLALTMLGIDAALMGKVGSDPFGELVQLLLRERWGITGGMIVDADAATSYTVVINPAGYDRMFLHCPGANDSFRAGDVDYEQVAKAKLFHFGYPPLMAGMFADDGRELLEIFRRVHQAGVTTSLDLALPDPASPAGQADWASILRRVMPHVDIFLPSAEELCFMLDRKRFNAYRDRGEALDHFTGDDLHALAEQLLSWGARIVCIKCGPRGYYLRTAGRERLSNIGRAQPGDANAWANRELWHPTFHIDGPPNATGSGDSSIAGFLAAWRRGLSPEQALQAATGNGALNVSAPDALSGLLPWEQLQAKIDGGWTADPLEVVGEGWQREGTFWTGPAEQA
jgi:sugar/nucleoside kinase (ribokinase family)